MERIHFIRLSEICRKPSPLLSSIGSLQESSGSVAVICLCLLSYLPDVQFFDQVLDALIDFWELSLDKVRLLLDGLKATSVPKAAQTITLQAKVHMFCMQARYKRHSAVRDAVRCCRLNFPCT